MSSRLMPCGTRAAYKRGCRCDDCAEASSAYIREHRFPEPDGPSSISAVSWWSRIPLPGPWVEDAACRGYNPELFFPGRGESVAQAVEVCADCPVAGECGEYAVVNHVRWGIWGGLTERARQRIRSRRRLAS